MRRSMLARFAALALTVSAVTGLSMALTAANVVPATKAGDGSGAISGYTVDGTTPNNVHYTLNSTDPTKIDSVTFKVDTAPVAGSTMKVQLDQPSGAWYSCTNSTTTLTCSTTGALVLDADNLRVVIAD